MASSLAGNSSPKSQLQTPTNSNSGPQVPTPQQEDPIRKIYDVLHADERYTKSYDEFKNKYSNKENIDKLYRVLYEDGDYTKSSDEFYNKYFPSLRGAGDPLEKLYNGLHADGKYTKSYDEFKVKYSTPENIKKLYDGLTEDGDYTKSYDEFEAKYFPSIKKKEVGGETSSTGLELSQENAIELANQRKENMALVDEWDSYNKKMLQTAGVGAPQTPTGEYRKKVEDINKQLLDAGYSESDADDIAGLPVNDVYSYDLKEIMPLKKLDPERYQRMLASIRYQGKIVNRIEAEQGKADAKEAVHYFKSLQSIENYGHAREGTRQLVAMANNDPEIIKDIVIGRSFAYGALFSNRDEIIHNDPNYIANGGDLNYYQVTAIHMLEDTDPGTAAIYKRLLNSKGVGTDLVDSKIGYDIKARELENIGLGIANVALKQHLIARPGDIDAKQRYALLQQELATQNSRYPAAAQMDAQRAMQEALGSRNGNFKKFLLSVGSDVRDTKNWLGDLLVAPFRSEESNNLADLELLGEKEFTEAVQNYSPENQRLIGSDFVVKFSPDLQLAIKGIADNIDMDYEEKASKVSDLITQNFDRVERVLNSQAGKANFTAKAIVSNIGTVGAQLFSQLSIGYLTGGAGSASKLRQFASLFGSTYATSYDDFYTEAIRNNIKNPSTYATLHAGIEASSELINNDFTMAKRVIGGKGVLGAVLNGTTEEIWDKARATGLWKALVETGKTATINAVKETKEEVVGQLAQNITDKYAFDQDIEFTSSTTDAAITTMAAMVPLGLLGLPFKYSEVTRNKKYALYEMGSRPNDFIQGIEKDLKDGLISQSQASERAAFINKAAAAVNNSVSTKIDGTSLSDNEKTEYVFKQAVLQTVVEQEKIVPPALQDRLKVVREQLQAEQAEMLMPAVEEQIQPNADSQGVSENNEAAFQQMATVPETQTSLPTEADNDNFIVDIERGVGSGATQDQVKTYQDKIKPFTSAIRNAASKIREFELKDDQGEKIGGAMTDLSAIPRYVMAKGLDIVAEVLDTGASIADAIKSSVDYIMKEHPGANEVQVRDAVGNYLGDLLPNESVHKKSLKSTIAAATQTGKMAGEKISLTPRQALHKQIRDIARGAKEGYKAGIAVDKEMHKKMAENIKGLLTDAKNKQHISSQQWDVLYKRATEIGTNGKRFTKFSAFVDNVLKDADYKSKLDRANDLHGKIANGAKNKTYDRSAYTNQSVKRFARIDPTKVENIDDYNAIAEKIVPVAEGIKATVKNGVAETSNEVFRTTKQSIDDYIEKHSQHLNETAKKQLTEDYADMVSQGIIDPATMSLQEMQELVDAVRGNNQDHVMRAAELFNNQQSKLEALKAAVDYNMIALEESPAYTAKENQIVKQLKDIDIDKLDPVQLAKLNDVINNIVINNDFTGSQAMAILSDAQKSVGKAQEALRNSDIKNLGSIRNALAQGFASIALMNEYIFKSTKLASVMQHLSGATAIFDGHARAKLMQDDVIKEFDKIKASMPGDIDSPLNRIRRGIAADIMNNFGGTPEEIDTEFKRRKNWIKQTGEKLEQSNDKEESAEGKLILQVYDELLANANIAADVIKKSSANNLKLIKFWRDKFEGRRESTQLNAELLNNKVWEDVEDYTATKLKEPGGLVGMDTEDLKEIFSNSYVQEKLAQQIAGSKNKKIRSANLPEGKVLNLDFDNVQSRVFYRTNFDVETSEAIEKVRGFFADKRTDRLYGGIGNKKIVMNSIAEAVNAQRGQLPPSSAADKIVNTLTDVIRAKGVRIALGSISQFVKQYPSVAMSTLVNLGGDAYLFGKAFMVPNNIPLFKEFAIGLRGDTQAGFNKEVKLGEITAAKFSFSLTTPLARIKDKTDKLTDLIMAALVQSDVSVARTSWLAYYMQDLKRQGVDIDNIDWKNEHLNPNYEAAAYAEQQVSRTQNPNDVSSGSAFYRDARGTAGFFKNLVLPFSTFVVNARVRMTNDVQKILYGGNKAEAYKSLAGTVAEMVAFNAIKTYLIATLTTMGARGVASLFGMWDDDDEAKADNKEQLTLETKYGEVSLSAKTKRLVANATSDFFFSGLGSLTQSTANQGINALYKMAVTEYYADGQMNKYPSLFYTRSDTDKTPDYSPYGLYGTLATKVAAMKNSARYSLTGTYSGVGSNYQDVDVELTDEERKLYTLSFIVDAFGIAGLSDADILTLNQKLKWIADRKMADKYGVQDKLMERNVKSR